MTKSIRYTLYLIFTTHSICTLATKITPQIKAPSDHERSIQLRVQLDPDDFMYEEYIELSVDNPATTLSDWQTDFEPIAYYDSKFKDTKQIFNKDFTITAQAHCKPGKKLEDTQIRMNYMTCKEGSFCEKIIPLALNEKKPTAQFDKKNLESSQMPEVQKSTVPAQQQPIRHATAKGLSWKQYISTLIDTTQKPLVRILLVFLLGLLVSLTPCIYPMIPITIGILQAHAGKSMARNFLSAFCYTLGLSVTFSALGLLAAFAGQQIGSFMTSPWVIILIVVLLLYVAFSLLGFYKLYIPHFLHTTKTVYSGSLLSAFVLGLVSGTIASPCVSPALFLVLTIVSHIQSLLWGFLLLLAFGFGMSVPLLIIGTFSTTLNLLPKAGTWMLEIKYVLGFSLIGMCFYFLNFILPYHILLWLIALFVFVIGIFYLRKAQQCTNQLRPIKTFVGIIFTGSSVFFVAKGIQALFLK